MTSGKRVLEAQYYELGKEKGFEYRGGYTGFARDKVSWECPECGNIFESRLDNVRSGRGCRNCSIKKVADGARIPESQYKQCGKELGLEYLYGYTGLVADPVWWKWIECGHKWLASYSRAIHITECPQCNHSRSTPEEQYLFLADKLNVVYEAGYTGQTNSKVKWRCPVCGYRWESSYRVMRSKRVGHGCPNCARDKQRIPEKDYYSLGTKRGFVYLGGYTGRTADPVSWRCPKGHEWEARYNSIKHSKTNCPICSRQETARSTKNATEAQRISEEQYRTLGKECGLEYLGGYTGYVKDNVSWRWIECGHDFEACYSRVSYYDLHCPICHHASSLPESSYYELAEQSNLEYVSGYTGRTNDSSVLWRCRDCGNEWNTSYGVIYNGGGCPACANMFNGVRASKQQIEIAETLNGEINYKIGRRYADIALLDRRVVIEYDCWYWHRNKIEEDRERAQEIIDEGWKVLSIKSNSNIPTLEQLITAIAKLDTYGELVLNDWGNGDKISPTV